MLVQMVLQHQVHRWVQMDLSSRLNPKHLLHLGVHLVLVNQLDLMDLLDLLDLMNQLHL